MLKRLLESMRRGSSQVLNSAHHMIAEFIKRMCDISEQCLELSHAVTLIKITQSLDSASTPNPEVSNLKRHCIVIVFILPNPSRGFI